MNSVLKFNSKFRQKSKADKEKNAFERRNALHEGRN